MFVLDEMQNKEPIVNQEITPPIIDNGPLLHNAPLPALNPWPYEYFNQYQLPYFPMMINPMANYEQLMDKYFANEYEHPVAVLRNEPIFYANQGTDTFRVIVNREYYNQVYAK